MRIGRGRDEDPFGKRLGTADFEIAIEEVEGLRGNGGGAAVAVGDSAVGAVEKPESVVDVIADHRQIDAPPR